MRRILRPCIGTFRQLPRRLLSSASETLALFNEPPKLRQQKAQHVEDALRIVRAYATERYDQSLDLAVVLNVDSKRSDERVRGSVDLPHGTGRSVRVAVFARDELAEEARAAGAEVRGIVLHPASLRRPLTQYCARVLRWSVRRSL